MKKLLLPLLGLGLAATAMAQIPETTTVTLVLPENAEELVEVYSQKLNYETWDYDRTDYEFHAGENKYTFPSEAGTVLIVQLKDPGTYSMSHLWVTLPGQEPKDMADRYFSDWEGFALVQAYSEDFGWSQEIWDGSIWEPVIYSMAEARTATAQVYVDDPEKVEVRMGNLIPELESGWNEVKFNPEGEEFWSISSTEFKQLYSVKYNGEEVEFEYGEYTIECATTGAVLEILANYPDMPSHMVINVNAEGAGAIMGVTLDDEPVEDFSSFDLRVGQDVEIMFDNTLFKIDEVLCNGEAMEVGDYTSSVTITAKVAEYVIDVTAHPYGTHEYELIIDDATHIQKVAFGESYYFADTECGFTTGAQQMQQNEHTPYLVITPAYGYEIEAVGYDSAGNTVDFEFNKSYGAYIDVVENDIVKVQVTTTEFARDLEAWVYVHDVEAFSSLGMSNSDYDYIFANDASYGCPEFKNGYQSFNFATSDNEFYVFANCDGKDFYIYLDNEAVSAPYGFAYLTLKNKSVVKFYGAEAPELYHISFTLADVKADDLSVVADKVNEVAVAEGLDCLTGTEITISSSKEVSVTVDGAALEAVDGVYTIYATANQDIAITGLDGVANVLVDGAANSAVYNLQGMLVKKAATKADLKSLAPGIYVVGGRKVVVK